jgi:hypothetical protein
MHRAYCTKHHSGELVGSEEELVIWVPARLLLCAGKDADLAQYLTESLFRNGIFPGKLPGHAAARQWAAIYMSSTPQVRCLLIHALGLRLGVPAISFEGSCSSCGSGWPYAFAFEVKAFRRCPGSGRGIAI